MTQFPVRAAPGSFWSSEQKEAWAELLSKVTYRNHVRFELVPDLASLRLHYCVPDSTIGEESKNIIVTHNFPLPIEIEREEMPRILMDCIELAERHEANEWFRVDGSVVFDPHV